MKKQEKIDAPGRLNAQPKGRPDSSEYDPAKVAFWTYPMVIAWISWRDLAVVRTFWDEYRRRCWDHVPRIASGLTTLDLKYWKPADIRALGEFARRDSWAASGRAAAASNAPKVPSVSVSDAIQSLHAAASESKVSAIALDLQGSEVKIEAYSWSRLEVGTSDKWFDLPVYVGGKRKYKDPRFPRDEVMTMWPAQDATGEPKVAAAPSKPTPGRKKGQGSYAPLDEPFLEEMAALLENKSVASPEEAAKRVASRAHGGGTIESKAERLAKRYRSRVPSTKAQ